MVPQIFKDNFTKKKHFSIYEIWKWIIHDMDTFLDTQSRWIYLWSRLSMEARLREILVLVFGVFKDFCIMVRDLKVGPS